VTKAIFWSGKVRYPLFWTLFIIGYAVSTWLPVLSAKSDLLLLTRVFGEIFRGEFKNIGPEFAFALACAIVSVALALAFAMLFAHVMVIRLSLRRARKEFGADAPDENAFLANFDQVNQRLSRDPLIGHAWQEFAKTCMREEIVIRTIRPGTFFSPSLARERLMGMKLMPTIPGYFVGLGLLLTFVGLVMALSKATAGVTAGSPEGMTESLRELLDAATFKFSTSIAGLFSSLFLAFVFKIYSIIIENGFDLFCQKIEDRTHFLAPQYVLTRLANTSKEQLEELKAINDAQFFDRLGQTIAPALELAVGRAVEPLANQLEATVGKLEDTSRTGTEGLMNKFMDALHGGTGNELKELSATLAQTKEALSAAKADLAGSGQDFAQRIAEATERLSLLIADAGSQFQANNQASRETIGNLIQTLAAAADSTRERLDHDMTEVGRSATTAVRDGMADMLSQVERQMGEFRATVSAIQDQAGREAEASANRTRQATEETLAAARTAATETAQAIKSGFTEIVEKFALDVEKMSISLRASEQAFSSQASAARETVDRTNAASLAFNKAASDLTAAATPVLQASERIAVSSKAMEESTRNAVEGLRLGQEAARSLAERLEQGHKQVETAWRTYEERFGSVDQALSEAVRGLAAETTKQLESVVSFSLKIDDGCSRAVQALRGIAGSLQENTAELNENFNDFISELKIGRGEADAQRN